VDRAAQWRSRRSSPVKKHGPEESPKVMSETRRERPIADEPPPVVGSWPRAYAFVLGYLAVLILVFWLFTQHYRPE
jgi:hypothetical protein